MQMYPRVEPEQGGKIANRVSSVGVAGNRQPLLPSAPGGSLAHFPLALGAVLMVLCPALPRVIGKFVIVPDADHGQQLVYPPEIGIAAIGAIAQAIIGQCDDLGFGPQHPLRVRLARRGRSDAAIFEDVIAMMKRKTCGPCLTS